MMTNGIIFNTSLMNASIMMSAVSLSFSNNCVYEPDNTLVVDDPSNYPDCDIDLELDECAQWM